MIVSFRAPENRGALVEETGEVSAEDASGSDDAGSGGLGDAEFGVSDAPTTDCSAGVLYEGPASGSVGVGASCLATMPPSPSRRRLVRNLASFIPT